MIEDINIESGKRAALEEFLLRIRKRLSSQLKTVKLFGSEARGEATDESDIDLFVVVSPYSKETESYILDEAYEVSLQYDVVITPLVYGEDEVNSHLFQITPFYKNIMEEGISL
jgi:predicted nucleotidyltransferase